MKGFSFDSFVVHETNQAAFDVCRKLAVLEKDLPQPIVLLGESGSGKSHLLWAIVNQFRERNTKVGVALISSKDFPNKVKDLPNRPDKLQGKYPAILIVDELHLFEKDVTDLENVILAFQQSKQLVVIATNIHPSILPTLSGKLKSYIGNGSIIGIKPLPKSESAPIPEAATRQIAALKARIAELEAGKEKAGSVPDDAKNKIKSLQEQLEKVTHERDVARSALDHSETELLNLREELAQSQKNATTDTQDVGEIVDRLEKQKAALMERINALEKQIEELIEFTESISEEMAAAPEAELKSSAKQLTAAQEESELLRVIDGIRDTLKNFEGDGEETAEEAEASATAQKTLATIFEQLKTLDMLPKDKQPEPESKDAAEQKAETTDVADKDASAEETS